MDTRQSRVWGLFFDVHIQPSAIPQKSTEPTLGKRQARPSLPGYKDDLGRVPVPALYSKNGKEQTS